MQQKPKWWLLYAIFPLSAGLLYLDSRLTLQPEGHELFELGIVLISFGLMALWVRANTRPVAQESAPHTLYFSVPDSQGGQTLDPPMANRPNKPETKIEIDERAFIDYRGRYN